MTETDTDRGMALAAGWLARRDLFRSEVRARLDEAGVPACASVLARLQELGLLDDVRLATREAMRFADRAWSNRQIADRLRSRGADDEAIEQAVEGIGPEEDRAVAAVSGRAWDDKGPLKAARYLTGRGFEEEAVRAAVERRFAESARDGIVLNG